LPTTIEIVKALLSNYVVEFRENGRVYVVQIDRKDRRFIVITRYDRLKNTKLVYRARLRFKNIEKLK
jgi:TATA-binding protein-associated factor Taf7